MTIIVATAAVVVAVVSVIVLVRTKEQKLLCSVGETLESQFDVDDERNRSVL